MSLYRRFDPAELPSLVTTNTVGHRRLFNDPAAAQLFIEVVQEVSEETSCRVLAFVVMPNHVHLVLKPPSAFGLSRIVQLIKARFSRRYNVLTGKAGSLWQSRFHERALRSERELSAAIEYVHVNPVRAGLTVSASAYPWSSAGREHLTDLEAYLGQAKA